MGYISYHEIIIMAQYNTIIDIPINYQRDIYLVLIFIAMDFLRGNLNVIRYNIFLQGKSMSRLKQ